MKIQPTLDPHSEEYQQYDPVLAIIYNTEVGKSGTPFVICREHYKEKEEHLSKNAPECYLQVIALLPTHPNCETCLDD